MKFKIGSVKTKCMCAERAALHELVFAFAREMERRLLEKLDQGFNGWDEERWPISGQAGIVARLEANVKEGCPIDVANFAAFWWNRI